MIGQFLLDLLFPIECLGCQTEGVWLCSECLKSLPLRLARHCPFCETKTTGGETCPACRPGHALDGAISCLPYAHPLIQALIHAWKYQGIKSLSQPLARFVNRGLEDVCSGLRYRVKMLRQGLDTKGLRTFPVLPTLLLKNDTELIPIPLHKRRLRQRGFNQAEYLAREIINQRPSWSVAAIIERARSTTAQATLSGPDRHTNVQDAFSLTSPPGAALAKNFLLVDDVITTGNTCEALAKLLKSAGAASVWALTIAYGHPIKS